jgi:predicted acylesterase/phospholipase RssA
MIVFGRDGGTRHLNAIEGVGFSCAVPGLFCYDVFHDDPQTVGILERLFNKHQIWRATDGGVISNVPCRVAWESVMQGNIGTRNTFILAADVFAPSTSPTTLMWNPVQQLTRPVMAANKPFCDYLKTFRKPPNPLNLSPTREQLIKIVQRSHAEMEPDREIIRRALHPLPALTDITP